MNPAAELARAALRPGRQHGCGAILPVNRARELDAELRAALQCPGVLSDEIQRWRRAYLGALGVATHWARRIMDAAGECPFCLAAGGAP